MVTIRIPAPPPGLVSNLLGVVGLACVVVAIAFLTDWRWALLAAGVTLVGLVVLGQTGAAQSRPDNLRPVRPAAVKAG